MAEPDENIAPTANSLDDVVPSQIKQAFNIAEHAESPGNDLRNKPLAVRINASVPAARKSAYIELASLYGGECAPDASMVAEHAEHIPHMLNDKAPLCQEGALDAALAWMQHAPVEVAASVASVVAKALAEKHTSGKYQAKAIEALVALLRSGNSGAVQSALAAGVKSKVPKTIAASLKASSEVLAVCGGAAFDAQPHIKALPDLLQHRDKSVRDEAAGMLGVIRLHHGDGVFKELKAVPEDRLVALREAPLPEPRLDPAAGDVQGHASAGGRDSGRDGGVPVAPIPISRPPFDLLAKLPRTKGSAIPADGWEKSLASDKWAERKKAADTILELLDGETSLKLPADYTVVAKGLKKLYGDANVNVVASAIKATSALADILGKDFGSHAKRVAPALLEKGADKKTIVADAVRAALETLSSSRCLSVVDAAEVALAGVKASLNPALRCTAARWLAAAASSAASEPATLAKALPGLDAALALLDEDSAAEVRSLAVEASASVARALPSEEAQAWIAGMPPKRGEKLSRAVVEGSSVESAQNAVAGSDVGASERAACGASAATSVLSIELSAPATSSHTSSRPASARAPPPGKRPSSSSEVKAGTRPARAASAGNKQAVTGGAAAWLEPELPGADDLSAAVEGEDVPPAAVRTGMADAAWGTRVQALADLAAHVRGLAAEEVTPAFAELLLWQLSALLAKEKNEQVMSKAMEAIGVLALAAPLLARRSASRVLGAVAERLVSKRVKSAAAEALLALAEAVGPTWVVSQLHNHALGHKNPKVLSETLVVLAAALAAFGPRALSPAGALGVAVPAMESRDASVREAAMKLILALRRELGPALLSSPQLAELKEVVRKQLDSESAAMGDTPKPSPPTRSFRHDAARAPAAAAAATNAAPASLGSASCFLDELAPRVDLLRERVNPDVIAKLKHADWKERKAALDVVSAALRDAPRLSPVVGPLLEALVPRVGDKQQALAVAALNAIGCIGHGVGKAVRPYIRAILPAVLVALGDGKATTRDAALEALNKWVGETTFDPLLPLLPGGMAMESPAGRAKLICWLTSFVPLLDATAETRPLLAGLLRNLDDRTPEVRAAAAAALEALLRAGLLSVEDMDVQAGKLSAATAKKLAPALARLRSAAPGAPAEVEPAAPSLSNATLGRNAGAPASRIVSRSTLGGSASSGTSSGAAAGSIAAKPSMLRSATMGSIPPPRGVHLGAPAHRDAASARPASARAGGTITAPPHAPGRVAITRVAQPSPAKPRPPVASPAEARPPPASPAKPRPTASSPAKPQASARPLKSPAHTRPAKSPAATRTPSRNPPGDVGDPVVRRLSARKGLGDEITLIGSQQATQHEVLKALSALSSAVGESPDAVSVLLQPLAEALATRLRTSLRTPSALTQCKKALQLMIDMLGSVRLVGSLEQPQIRLLILELLERLLDPCLADFGAEVAQHLLETLNFIMLRLLQHSPRGPTLCALLQLLSEKGTLPSQRELSGLVLKCIAKLNKTLGDMAPQIDLPPVMSELSDLSATLAAAERDAPAELATQIGAAADATLCAIVAVRGHEVLDALRAAAERGGGDGRTPGSTRKLPRSSAPLLRRVQELLRIDASPQRRLPGGCASSLSRPDLSTPSRSANKPRAASTPGMLRKSASKQSRTTPSKRVPNGESKSAVGTPGRSGALTPSRGGTPGGARARKSPGSVHYTRAAEADPTASDDTTIASAIARLNEMKKKYNIQATPARTRASSSAVAQGGNPASVLVADAAVPSTPVELQAVRAKLAKHGYTKPADN